MSSLCARRARFFALTPSPSPTLWVWGVGAHGGAPCSAFPLSRRRERGTKGVRAIQRTCRFTLALGKIAPASKTSCRTVVPLPGGTRGVRTKERACLAATAHGKIAPTPEILYLTAVPLSGVGVRARCLIPIARAEFTIAPLLKVPPASRGEPCGKSVPPACRGNLKEGVIGHTRFCELWLRDWY